MSELKERGMTAAKAYLERVGVDVLDDDGKHAIIALDDGVLVHVEVLVADSNRAMECARKRAPSLKKRLAKLLHFAEENNMDNMIRFEEISIHAISDDRALLRHNKEVHND